MDPLIEAGVALVTGAGSGIGQEVATQLALSGCKKLFLVDISLPGLERTQAILQERFPAAKTALCQTNITNEKEVANMVEKCVEVYGRIDFASNNAGIGTSNAKTADETLDNFDRICNINEKGAFFCEKFEIRQMLKQEPLPVVLPAYAGQRGSIVNTASLCGLGVLPTIAAYNSSKHAVVQFSGVDARDFAPERIRINTVCPGFVETPMLMGSNLSQEWIDGAKAQSPMNRLLQPLEIANAIVFLSSSKASGITGVNLPVDCGAQLFHAA